MEDTKQTKHLNMEDTKQTKHLNMENTKQTKHLNMEECLNVWFVLYLPCFKCLVCFVSSMF
jgi:hypothetical protein